ncbi:MAG: hypothetical protein M3220_07235 [Chloroflexota bacterium]|nr:hypothetical protein [Chloroflexota bacterium]
MLSNHRVYMLLITLFILPMLLACGAAQPLAALATPTVEPAVETEVEPEERDVTATLVVEDTEMSAPTNTPLPTTTVASSETPTATVLAGDIGMDPSLTLTTTVQRVQETPELGSVATVFIEPQTEYAIDVSEETLVRFEDGHPATLADLQPGTRIEVTGGTNGGGGGALYAQEIIILTPAPEVHVEVTPLAEAVRVRGAGWSPDGRFLLYRTSTQADLEINPQYTPGDFHVYDTERPDMRCTQVVDHHQLRPHVWLNERELLYVTDTGEVAVWPVCTDERATWTERFPEIPLTILASSPDGTRFLYGGQTGYWLFDTTALEARRVEGLTEEEVGIPGTPSPDLPVVEWNSAAWSPDGSKLAISFHSGDTVVVDAASGALLHRVEAEPLDGKGSPPAPLWLSDTHFLIPDTPDRGPLEVTQGEEGWEVTSLVETLVPGTTLEGQAVAVWFAWAARDAQSGGYHTILVGFDEQGWGVTYPLLYHSEHDEGEELRYSVHNSAQLLPREFSEDGRVLLLDLTMNVEGRYQQEAWLRPLDPPSTQPHLVVKEGQKYPHLSPSGRWIAVTEETGVALIDGMTGAEVQQWAIADAGAWEWSPDGEWIVAGVQEEGVARLYLLPVQP